MPVKFIGTIILVVLVAIFTGLNWNNPADIWFFHTFKLPVAILIIGSFVLGVIVTLSFVFAKRQSEKRIAQHASQTSEDEKESENTEEQVEVKDSKKNSQADTQVKNASKKSKAKTK